MVPCHGAVSRGLFLTWSDRIWRWSTIPCSYLCTQHHLCILNMVSLDRPRYVFVLRLTSRFGPLASKKHISGHDRDDGAPHHAITGLVSAALSVHYRETILKCGVECRLNWMTVYRWIRHIFFYHESDNTADSTVQPFPPCVDFSPNYQNKKK